MVFYKGDIICWVLVNVQWMQRFNYTETPITSHCDKPLLCPNVFRGLVMHWCATVAEH